ncbi:MAG: MFS transporter [Acidobacteriota bacterium]|nr:MFS transporter [Acidobacteriota bacterium]
MSDPSPGGPSQQKLIHVALFAGFIITGMACTILGPILPVFIARWNLSDMQAGFFFTAQFAGSFLGVLLSSLLLSTRGYRETLMLGFFLMAAGIARLDASSSHTALIATGVTGFGFGLAIPATNLCIAEIAGLRRSAALNILNMAWGSGAIICPLLILAGLKAGIFTLALFSVALAALLLSILFWSMKFGSKSASSKSPDSHHAQAHPPHVPFILAILFYVYVGTENGISGWAAEQARRIGSGSSATIVPMFFWAGLLSGRGISALVVSRVKENYLVLHGLALSGLGTTLLLLASTRFQIICGVLLAGLGLASIYPIFISWLSKLYGERARRLGGFMFSLAALGGATVPWVVGFVSQRSHSLRTGLLVPLAGCLAMIILVVALRRRIAA